MMLRSVFKRLLGDGDEAPARGASLAVFGKHPGWNDHLDDQGLDNATLVDFKRLLYLEGIGRNIDAGNWEALPADRRLEAFDHAMLALGGNLGVLVGRMWPSSDGRGRKQYPMVAVAHVTGLELDAALRHAWPVVREVEAACRATTEASAVVTAAADGRAKLQTAVAADASPPADSPAEVLRRLRQSSNGQPENWPRILYRFEDELKANQWRVGGGRGEHIPPGTDLRVPAGPGEPDVVLAGWGAFVQSVAGRLPAYLFAPAAGDWVDIFVHAPTPQQLFALRTTTARIPLVTDIPFTLDADFQQRAAQWP